MQPLNLDRSSRALLTRTDNIPDPNDPSKTVAVTYLCDFSGNRLPLGATSIPIYRDTFTAKTFAMIAAQIPSGQGAADREAASAITKLNPIHYNDSNGTLNGWFVEAPDFNGREGK